MPNAFSVTPFKYGDVYPPTNSDSITKELNKPWYDLRASTQTRNRIEAGGVTYAEDFCYGFILANTGTSDIQLKINGVDSGTIGPSKLRPLTADTTIFGYSITPSYIDLWTSSDYRDQSAEVMYGKRGIRVSLSTFNDWDMTYGSVTENTNRVSRAFLHGVNNTAVNIIKTESSTGTEFHITTSFTGNVFDSSQPSTPFKGYLTSDVISTLELESVVNALQQQIKNINNQLDQLQQEVSSIVPSLTTTINYETSRLYASR